MATVTGNLRTINADPTLTKLKVIGVTRPWVVHGNLIYPADQLVTPNPSGFFAVRLVAGYYELWVGTNRVFILVPDDDNTYPFEELLVPAVNLPAPIVGGAVPTARVDQAGVVWTDSTVLKPTAATGIFYKGTAAKARSEILNPAKGDAAAQDNKILLVKSTGIFYEWDADSLAADDGTDNSPAIRLGDTSDLDPGRFVAVTSGTPAGGPPVGGNVIFGSGSPVGVLDAPVKTWYYATDLEGVWLKKGVGNTAWKEITT
jgi:hypothetical protein